ncbi:hypothetical protein [Micrococcus luteus]|uniref:hypothetical protein n=1 Tax=Micrococcus luteus TaxID=1270 RepID=UPI00211B64B4|nr:hypothetical protein [Micrococcus luteus]
MTAPASSDPLAPLPAGEGDGAAAEHGTAGGPAEAGAESGVGSGTGTGVGSGAARRTRDRRGRGLRHPRPYGERSERGRTEALLTAVEKAVDRLGALDAPGLRHVTALVERIPDRLDERLRALHAGAERDEETLFARAERQGQDGVVITLFERPLRDAADPDDLDGAVYGVALSRAAEALGVDPQVLDPDWGRA